MKLYDEGFFRTEAAGKRGKALGIGGVGLELSQQFLILLAHAVGTVADDFIEAPVADVLGHSDRKVTITRQGYGEFSVEDQSVSVWMDEELGLTPEGAVVV